MQATTGQVPEGKKKPPGLELDGSEARRCMTVKGRTGTLLYIGAAFGEGFDEQLGCLEEAVPLEFRAHVRTIKSDAPVVLKSQMARLRLVFPSLLAVSPGFWF